MTPEFKNLRNCTAGVENITTLSSATCTFTTVSRVVRHCGDWVCFISIR